MVIVIEKDKSMKLNQERSRNRSWGHGWKKFLRPARNAWCL